MTVRGLVIDPASQMPVVILQNPEGDAVGLQVVGLLQVHRNQQLVGRNGRRSS